MPIYEYTCEACGRDFEELVRSSDETISCPDCESTDVKRQMSAASFKSSGKYASSAGSGCSGCGGGSCSSCH